VAVVPWGLRATERERKREKREKREREKEQGEKGKIIDRCKRENQYSKPSARKRRRPPGR
jgi:hypothetical protein